MACVCVDFPSYGDSIFGLVPFSNTLLTFAFDLTVKSLLHRRRIPLRGSCVAECQGKAYACIEPRYSLLRLKIPTEIEARPVNISDVHRCFTFSA